MKLAHCQYITQGNTADEHLKNAVRAIENGCKWLQLRIKNAPISTIESIALTLRDICQNNDCKLTINDHVNIAKKINADGVHLGKKDMPPKEARVLLGKHTIIGGTANSFEDILYLCSQDVDYIGLGPFRFTSTKKELSPILGLQGYKDILYKMKLENKHIPIFAIGGILLQDIPSLIKTGVYGIAVSGLISQSDHPLQLLKDIKLCFKLES